MAFKIFNNCLPDVWWWWSFNR